MPRARACAGGCVSVAGVNRTTAKRNPRDRSPGALPAISPRSGLPERHAVARRVHRLAAMRRLAAICLCLLASGCGTRIVLTIPGSPFAVREAPAPRPDRECRYLSVLVGYSTQAAGMSARDVALSAEVAEAMKQEFQRLGAHVTDEPGQAYWSLMLLAVHNERDGGFIFSATLALRELAEARDTGIPTYTSGGGDGASAPTLYTGISYGSLEDVGRLARKFVQTADAALLPSARQLCAFDAQETLRHDAVDEQVPLPELPL